MNSKERIKTVLNHKTPDRIPIDFGGTPVTGIHILAIENLRNYFGLEKKPIKVIEPYQMLGDVEDDLKEAMGIDSVGLIGKKNMFGIVNENWKEFKMNWGQVVLVPGEFNTTSEPDGTLLIYPEGDTTIPPSAKMPGTGYFFDAIIRQEQINENNLNVEDNLEEFGAISQKELIYWENEIDKVKNSERAIVATFGGTAFGDIALVPAMQLKHSKGIRDVAEWYMSTVARTDYVHAIFEKQCEIGISNLAKLFDVVGNNVDAVFVCGTDFGTQNGQFCSSENFNELYAPYYKKVNAWIHENTSWKSMKHSCGAVEPFMENFINSGFDIINPVQVNAVGMDPKLLKEKYGEHMVFWGGGVDTQKVFPFGTPEEVEEQVLKHCEIFSMNGGFVFNTVHNIQATVPIKNIIAMLNGLRKFHGETPLKN